MALIKCPECGKEISTTAATCIHCGCVLKNVQNEENCITIYKKDKNSDMIFQIIGFISIALMLVCVTLFYLELSPLLSLKNFDNLSLEQQLKTMEEVIKGQSNLKNYQTIAVISGLLANLVTILARHNQNKAISGWLENYNLEKSLEKTFTENLKTLSEAELKKEKIIINKLLTSKVYDNKLQLLNFCNTCASGIFLVFLCLLGFNTLNTAYKHAIISVHINWENCISTPLVGICIFFLFIAIIFDLCYRIKLKNKKKQWIRKNVENGYTEYLKYFK